MISILVKEERSLWVLEKQYQWKFPRLGWNDPKQVLLGVKMGYHSRHDQEHYMTCETCYEDHLEFMQDQEIDDAPEEQNEDEN